MLGLDMSFLNWGDHPACISFLVQHIQLTIIATTSAVLFLAPSRRWDAFVW
jgi:hypothetical protein